MRLLLTSCGISNPTLRHALEHLLDGPIADAAVAYVITASVADPGDHGWLVADMVRAHGLGWKEFDVLELNGLPRAVVIDRLRHADVIYVEGGNHYHLARSITGNGLADEIRDLLESRVYVGSSAGSMIFSRNLTAHSAKVVGDGADLRLLGTETVDPPFGLFDWYVKPHLHSPDFPERDDAWADRLAERADFPLYLIDDATAIRVRGETLDVVSEGTWRYEAPSPR